MFWYDPFVACETICCFLNEKRVLNTFQCGFAKENFSHEIDYSDIKAKNSTRYRPMYNYYLLLSIASVFAINE